jgi:uncharacterized protein (TIGR03382 family)
MWLLFAIVSAGASEPWWSPDWSARARLRIDNAASAEDLTAFPLLVVLEEGRNFAHDAAQVGGGDLRFVDPTTGDELAYEIERWDDAGRSEVWVRVPLLRRGSDGEVLWMYYGNPDAPAQSAGSATWAGYLGVWHLSQPDATTDATGNNVTVSRGAPLAQPGQVGWGRSMTEPGHGYVVPDAAPLEVREAVTVSGWVWLADWRVTDAALVTREGDWALRRCGNGDQAAWSVHLDDGDDGVRRELCGGPAVDDERWHQIVGVYDAGGGGAALYVDGASVDTRTEDDPLEQDGEAEVSIANDEGVDASPVGTFDEVRIVGVGRSADWIYADWRSMSDALVTWCALDEADPHPPDPCVAADLVQGDPGEAPNGETDGQPGDPRVPAAEVHGAGGTVPGCGCGGGGASGVLALLVGSWAAVGRRRREVTAPR